MYEPLEKASAFTDVTKLGYKERVSRKPLGYISAAPGIPGGNCIPGGSPSMQKHIDIKRKVGIHEVNFQNKSNDVGSTNFS